MADYKSGVRDTSVPGRLPPRLMIGLSKAIAGAEVETAAAYFSALQPRKRIKVVESDVAPKSYIAGLLWAVEGSEREPLGQRILEIPDDLQVFESRELALDLYRLCAGRQPGEGRGAGDQRRPRKDGRMRPVPRAGPQGTWAIAEHRRSPSYMFRQLYDFRHGARTGEWSPLMAQVVSNLDQEDMLAIVAYLASLDP